MIFGEQGNCMMGDHLTRVGSWGQNMGIWNHRHKGSILSHPPWQPSICDWCPKHKSASFLQIWIGNIFPFGFICRPDNKYSVFCAGLQLLVYWDIHGKSWCCPNLPPSFQYNSIPRPHNPNVFDQLLSWGSFVFGPELVFLGGPTMDPQAQFGFPELQLSNSPPPPLPTPITLLQFFAIQIKTPKSKSHW